MFISQQTRVLNFSLVIGFSLPYSDNNPITWGRARAWEVLKREGGEDGLKLVASTEEVRRYLWLVPQGRAKPQRCFGGGNAGKFSSCSRLCRCRHSTNLNEKHGQRHIESIETRLTITHILKIEYTASISHTVDRA